MSVCFMIHAYLSRPSRDRTHIEDGRGISRRCREKTSLDARHSCRRRAIADPMGTNGNFFLSVARTIVKIIIEERWGWRRSGALFSARMHKVHSLLCSARQTYRAISQLQVSRRKLKRIAIVRPGARIASSIRELLEI